MAALEVDRPEVGLRRLRVVEPAGGIADVRRRTAPTVRQARHRYPADGIERQVDVVPDVRVRERLVEEVEEPGAELDLLLALDLEVLEDRQVVVHPGRRADV